MVVWIAFGVVVWVLLIALAAWLRPVMFRGEDDIEAALAFRGMWIVSHVLHNTTYEGLEHVRTIERAHAEGRPIIVAPNHTAGVDPLLVQTALRFEARWMMAADMRAPQLNDLWDYAKMIFVDRSTNDSKSLREAMRHLKGGGALGVFPEGHIERPPRRMLPFKAGIGLLVKSSKALVLPALIDGAPQTDTAWGSLLLPSRASVRFLEPVDYTAMNLDAQGIADDLRERFVRASGWEKTERVPIMVGGLKIMVGLDGGYFDETTGERLTDDEARARAEEASCGSA